MDLKSRKVEAPNQALNKIISVSLGISQEMADIEMHSSKELIIINNLSIVLLALN